MHDANAIEAINAEQLVTVTDRLLLRGGIARRRDSVPSLVVGARGSHPAPPARFAHGSGIYPRAALHPAPLVCSRLVRASSSHTYLTPLPTLASRVSARAAAEPTLFVRAVRPRAFPVAIVIPMLLGILIGLAAML